MKINALIVDTQAIANGLYEIICERERRSYRCVRDDSEMDHGFGGATHSGKDHCRELQTTET